MFSTHYKISSLAIVLVLQFVAQMAQVGTQTPPPSIPASQYDVRFHPGPPLYVGDTVSVEVYSPAGADLQKQQLTVSLEGSSPRELGKASFVPVSGNRYLATLQWFWNTNGLAAGSYTLQFSVAPAGTQWQQAVILEAAPPGQNPHWISTETSCCTVYLISGTDAERDLALLLPEIDDQARQVQLELHHQLSKKIEINLLPLVLGQSGFTTDQIYVSYTDLNYTDTDFLLILHHEMVHFVDADMGGDLRPSLLAEGLAVYMTGGHYRSEPLSRRAATLLELGRYIPLTSLADNFYSWQHEIGYLEAGSLLEYMIQTWGWDAYNNFYRDIHPVQGGSESQAMDKALQSHFGLTLRLLDDRFLSYLQSIPVIPQLRDDVQLTADLFDTIRLFQRERQPSAYFQQVWLPDAKQMRERGIVADYTLRSISSQDEVLEISLADAGDDWLNGDYNGAEKQLYLINQQLRTRPAAQTSPH
jgi:hypothetical protein